MLFDIQNNDFGRWCLPTSKMYSNTVFMIMMAVMKNFYSPFVKKVSEVFTDIPLASRIKHFIFRFICVAGKWIRQSRQWKFRLYTNLSNSQLQNMLIKNQITDLIILLNQRLNPLSCLSVCFNFTIIFLFER